MTPPCQGAAAPPPSSPMAAALSGAFEAFFLLLPPPTHRRPAQSRSGHAVGWWGPQHGAAASPAPRARCLAPLLAQSWRKREFCPFRQSFSASLRRRAHSLSKSERSCGAGPARQTYSVRGEEGRTQPRTLWELVLETRASRDVARATLVLGGRAGSRLHCLGQEWSRKGAQAPLHHCHQGKPWGVTEPDMIRILPKASLGSALQPDQEWHLEYPRVWDKPCSVATVKRRMVLLCKGGWHTGLAA